MLKQTILVGAMAAGVALLLPADAVAGTLQWAAAADTVTQEGGGVGFALTGLAIVLTGIVLALSYHSLLTMVLSLTLGGALAANYDPIRAALFPGGGGGGSIYDVASAPAPEDLPIKWRA